MVEQLRSRPCGAAETEGAPPGLEPGTSDHRDGAPSSPWVGLLAAGPLWTREQWNYLAHDGLRGALWAGSLWCGVDSPL